MKISPIVGHRLPPRVVIDFRDRHPIVIDPVVGTPATVDGRPAWVTTGRSRPRYFDGRFLAARDLQRDQDYFAARQRDELRAVGQGVVHGLDVRVKGATQLTLAAGIAITPDGQLVVLREGFDLELDDIAATQRLDGNFGLLAEPRDVSRRRTGTYVLLARPVTYTADPIALYPQSIEERREPEDGDIIEAVAFTLAPYHDRAIDVEPSRVRANLARRIFVEKSAGGTPIDAVPLALVQLERGFVRWADAWLVRREIGTIHDGIAAFSRSPRALAEAHVQHYHEHLAAIEADRKQAARPAAFSASEELAALPPVGEFPVTSLDLSTATERFFPAPMPVQLQVVPDDELATLLGEQLALPPIDLGAPDEQLAVTPVAVLLPVPRSTAETLAANLRSFPLRTSASVPGRSRARDAVVLTSIAARFLATPTKDDRGDQLAKQLGEIHAAYFVRLRRSHGLAQDGVVAVENQQIG
jgi:hypothetical protein